MSFSRHLLLVLVAVLALAGVGLAASSGTTLSFQGKLTDENGDPVTDGPYTVTFTLYTVASGGTAVWTEVHDGGAGNPAEVQTTDGLFQAVLGTDADAPLDEIFDGTDHWLAIMVESDAEMTPRIKLAAAAHALVATKRVDIDNSGSDNSIEVTNGASSHFFVKSDGKVGIGTSSPDRLIDIVGDSYGAVKIDSTEADATTKYGALMGTQYANANSLWRPIGWQASSSTNQVQIGGGYSGIDAATVVTFHTATAVNTSTGSERMRVDPNGRVLVGLATNNTYFSVVPQLEVRTPGSTQGLIAVNTETGNSSEFVWAVGNAVKWFVQARGADTPTDRLAFWDKNMGERMSLTQDGDLGIGDSNPGTRLDVKDSVAGFVATIENTDSSPNACGLSVVLGPASPATTNDYVKFYKSGGIAGAIEGNGSGGVTNASAGGDFAEYFVKLDPAEHLSPGRIVYLVGNAVTGNPDSLWHTAGIVSHSPGFVGAAPFGELSDVEDSAILDLVTREFDAEVVRPATFSGLAEEEKWLESRRAAIESRKHNRIAHLLKQRTHEVREQYCLVALVGRVTVSIKGRAEAGDYILYDGIPCKRKDLTFEQYQTCVGKALESGEGQVLCLVGVR